MAIHEVIWGKYKDWWIETTHICYGKGNDVPLNDKTIKTYEVITEYSHSGTSYSMTKGVLGSALFGAAGAGAGIKNTSYSEYRVLVIWKKDDQRSIFEMDGTHYREFILQMTKYNIPDMHTYNQLQAQQAVVPVIQQSDDFEIDYFTDQENLIEVEDIFFTKSLVTKTVKVYFKFRNISPHEFNHIKIQISLMPPRSLRNSLKDYEVEFQNNTIAVQYRTVFTVEVDNLKPEDMKDKQVKITVIEINHDLLHSYQVKNTVQNTICQINDGWYDLEFVLAMPEEAETQKTQKLQKLTGLSFRECREIVEEITYNGFIPPEIEV